MKQNFQVLDKEGNVIGNVVAATQAEAQKLFIDHMKSEVTKSLKDFERWIRDMNTRNIIYNKRLSPFMVLGRKFDRPKHFTNTNNPQTVSQIGLQ